MPLYTPDFKQHVLQHYQACVVSSGFAALATRFAIRGGARTVHRWYHRWDGSMASLQRRPGGGRPRILSQQEVQRHIVRSDAILLTSIRMNPKLRRA